MSPTRHTPGWAQPGATVVEVADGGRRGRRLVAIARVTATTVTTDEGHVYRSSGRHPNPSRQPGGRHSTSYVLRLPLSDDERQALAAAT